MKLQVLNPVARVPKATGRLSPMARRLSSFEGTTIGLYWNHKPGGNAATGRVAELLQERFPGIKTKHYVGSVGAAIRHLTQDDVKRIANEVTAVVGSTAD